MNCETATAKQISTVSKIAREEVYQVLPRLHSLGLIEKIFERPIKYKPIPLKECVRNLIEERKNRTQELEIKAKELISKYEETSSNEKISTQIPRFIFVPSKQALIRKLRKSVTQAKSSICVSTSCKRFTYACDCLNDVLKSAWERGVKGRAIINNPEENHIDLIKNSWIPPLAEIRCTPNNPKTIIAMYDKNEVFIFTDPDADLKDSPALWSNYPSIVSIAENFFEILWITAMEIPNYNLNTP